MGRGAAGVGLQSARFASYLVSRISFLVSRSSYLADEHQAPFPTEIRDSRYEIRSDAGQVYYYGARFYDPRVARFSTMDPVRQFANPYAYVGWNPVMRSDPTGMIAGLGGEFFGLNPGALEPTILERDYDETLKWRGVGHGGFNGPKGGGPGGGFGSGAGGAGDEGGGGETGAAVEGFTEVMFGSSNDPSAVAMHLTTYTMDEVIVTGDRPSAIATILQAVGVAVLTGVAVGVAAVGLVALAGGRAVAVPGALIAGAFGAAVGAASALMSGTGPLEGAALGAAFGVALGTLPATPAGVLLQAVGGAAVGAATSALTQLHAFGSVDGGSVFTSGAMGAASGLFGGSATLAYGGTAGAVVAGVHDLGFAALTQFEVSSER